MEYFLIADEFVNDTIAFHPLVFDRSGESGRALAEDLADQPRKVGGPFFLPSQRVFPGQAQ